MNSFMPNWANASYQPARPHITHIKFYYLQFLILILRRGVVPDDEVPPPVDATGCGNTGLSALIDSWVISMLLRSAINCSRRSTRSRTVSIQNKNLFIGIILYVDSKKCPCCFSFQLPLFAYFFALPYFHFNHSLCLLQYMVAVVCMYVCRLSGGSVAWPPGPTQQYYQIPTLPFVPL